jgi:hypothetical protein
MLEWTKKSVGVARPAALSAAAGLSLSTPSIHLGKKQRSDHHDLLLLHGLTNSDKSGKQTENVHKSPSPIKASGACFQYRQIAMLLFPFFRESIIAFR